MGSPSPWMRVKKLRDDALAYYHADARRAQEIAAAALEVALATDDPRAHGWGYRAAAESSLFAGRMRDADRAYRAATKAFAATDDPATLGQLLVGHVHVLTHLGDPAAALATAIRARELLTRAGDTVYLAKLAMNLGNYHAQGERPREALAEYDTAARILRRRPPQDGTLLGLEINRGVALTQLDRHQEALVAFARIQDAPQAGAHPILVAQARMNAAYVHGLRAEVDQALAAWSRAGAVFEAQGHPKLLGSCLLGRAEILNQLNLHDRASALAAQARDLFAEAGLPYDEGLAELELALAALGRGDPAGAAPHERRARQRFAREGNEARLGVLDLLRA
jgi:tetratricopeptide (TPR) repeat protein